MSQKKHGWIEEYLLTNPIDRSQPNPYQSASQTLGVDKEHVRRAWRNLRHAGLVEKQINYAHVINPKQPELPFTTTTTGPTDFTYTYQGNSAQVSKITNREVKNELDLAEDCDIDLSEWKIIKWECKRYNAWIKNKDGEIESQPKYSVSAKMERVVADKDLQKQKEVIIKELFDSAPEIQIFEAFPDGDEAPIKDTLLELSLPDLHIGKLAHRDESGEDYDSKIACARFEHAISKLLSRVNLSKVERILFPIGNDMLQVDQNTSQTTAGTFVDSDGRFHKMVNLAKEVLIKSITKLAIIAPVDVIVIPGNHDRNTMFLLGCVVEAYFHNTDRVTVDNSAAPRKYYKYGEVGIQLAHGDEEKQTELGLIFATEQPTLWATTKYRFSQLGHLHKTKKTNWVSVDEHQGFQVEIIPSLSSSDAWHARKGYMSKKAAKAFQYTKDEGRIGEFTFTV
jgi:hypothetical protein